MIVAFVEIVKIRVGIALHPARGEIVQLLSNKTEVAIVALAELA